MDYQGMSNSQINEAVSEIVGIEYTAIGEVDDPFNPKDYCNSWEWSGQIIKDYGIELSYDGVSWSAKSGVWNVEWVSDWKNYPEEPLRMAMIVFLMIKGSEL